LLFGAGAGQVSTEWRERERVRVSTLLLVALGEGKGVTEYARQAGVGQTVMSRHLLDLEDRPRDGRPGFGLVTWRTGPLNLRRHQRMLRDRGRVVAGGGWRLLGRTSPVMAAQVGDMNQHRQS
jgi:hypothetical protein